MDRLGRHEINHVTQPSSAETLWHSAADQLVAVSLNTPEHHSAWYTYMLAVTVHAEAQPTLHTEGAGGYECDALNMLYSAGIAAAKRRRGEAVLHDQTLQLSAARWRSAWRVALASVVLPRHAPPHAEMTPEALLAGLLDGAYTYRFRADDAPLGALVRLVPTGPGDLPVQRPSNCG